MQPTSSPVYADAILADSQWVISIRKTLALIFSVQLKNVKNYIYEKNMHVYQAKSSRFESTDSVSVMIADVISVLSMHMYRDNPT